jgi:hypothetical protein
MTYRARATRKAAESARAPDLTNGIQLMRSQNGLDKAAPSPQIAADGLLTAFVSLRKNRPARGKRAWHDRARQFICRFRQSL